MSKKIILNDNEVVFNEDVAAAQDFRQLDFNRLLEAQWSGRFGQGPFIPGSKVGACVVSDLGIFPSNTDLSVSIAGGSALFGFGNAFGPTGSNIYQLSSAEGTTVLPLGVSHPTQTRWDIIEVSVDKIVTNETRKVLTSFGPSRRLVDVSVPKLEENRLKFRVRSGTPAIGSAALIPFIQPDAAWLPLYAINIPPLALTASLSTIYDLRLWLSNFTTTNADSILTDGWRSTPSVVLENPSLLSVSSNVVTLLGYNAPVSSNLVGSTPTRLRLDINAQRPPGIVSYNVDQWYYVYVTRPHRNCGLTTLSISDLPPPLGPNLPEGTRQGISLSSPWPTDSSSRSRYLCSVKLYELGGSNYGIRTFARVGNFVSMSSILFPSAPPGANVLNKFVDLSSTAVPAVVRINPAVGSALVPPHVKLVKTTWYVKPLVTDVTFSLMTKEGFIIDAQSISMGTSYSTTLDVPLPADGTTEVYYRVAGGAIELRAATVGYYEDLA